VLSTRWLLVRLLLVALRGGGLSPRVTWHASLLWISALQAASFRSGAVSWMLAVAYIADL